MTACTNFNHHQTNITKQISQDCPLQHTHNRVPKRAEMNPLSRIIITPDTVPKFVIPRNRPTRLVTRPTSEITSDDAISDCASFNTNDRPSLPHLRMKRTPYGFSFLAESPKTSRKESLYRKKNKYQATEQNLTVQQIDYDTFIAGSLDGMYDWSSTSPSSRGSLSPASSPLVHKNCISKAGFGLSSSQSHGHLGNSNPVQNRPMSFPSTPTLIRASTMMHVNPNAMQTSSSVNRRASMPLLGDIKYQKKRSRSLRALQPDMLHLHCMRRRSVVRDLGEVHLKLQYIRQRDYLDVEVIRAENLGGSVYTGPINPILKLSLTPEKNHPKYKTINMKGTRDPQFNQNFSYTNIKPLQLMHLNLRIKVLSKKSNLRRAEHIGDIIQPLNFLIDESIHEIKANVKPCLQYTTEYVDKLVIIVVIDLQ
ncbi:C2 calcium-dependent domain-containing protein 4C-like [Antedon mediterranea]|uniref:C2 calcium-dependent domain-containing protein 4C-like n=1 Tax=Antedon mediterranea TaxID=105859 RepID=UPI003AF624FB